MRFTGEFYAMIKNSIELERKLSKPAMKAIKEISESMIDILRKYIDVMTYGIPGGLPNAYYYNGSKMPTFQFREAFQFSPIDFIFNEIETELFYNWEEMDYDGATFLHGYIDVDNRAALADILNVNTDEISQLGSAGDSAVLQKKREPYWDEFILRMFLDEELDKITDKYFKKNFGELGISLVKS